MNRVPWRALLLAALALLACAGRGVAQGPKDEEIAEAIKKGVIYLKSQQKADGTWPHNDIGATALAAWTLMECGVDPKEACIQKAAAAFRKQIPIMTFPYTVALGVFFLDRLGDEADIPLIEALGIRLICGQNGSGGWLYGMDGPTPEESAFLTDYLANMKPGTLNPKLPKDRKVRTLDQVTPVFQKRMLAYLNSPPPKANPAAPGDNSCTQFAMMACWVARRYGLAPERCLLLTEFRFRQIQYDTGGWGYDVAKSPYDKGNPESGPTLAMTSAGLLSLALGHAVDPRRAKLDLNKDRQVLAAFSSIASSIGNPVGDRDKVPSLKKLGRMYYALWSLERMAVVFGLEKHKIGTKDWFGWGAELLIANQNFDGSWTGKYTLGACDTSWALLFLTRANVAVDLTNKVKSAPPKVKENPRLVIPDLPNIVSKEEGPKTKTKEKNSPSKADNSAKQLAEQLLSAAPAKLDSVLEKFKDGRGTSYTEALAESIPKLKGESKTKSRAVLTERLMQNPVSSLTGYLKSEHLELRRSAALAVGAKKSKAHISELINMLEDAEPPVAHAAHRALVQITGQDFGPEDDASRAERATAAKAWRAWQKSK